jgi:hypothetical protein
MPLSEFVEIEMQFHLLQRLDSIVLDNRINILALFTQIELFGLCLRALLTMQMKYRMLPRYFVFALLPDNLRSMSYVNRVIVIALIDVQKGKLSVQLFPHY